MVRAKRKLIDLESPVLDDRCSKARQRSLSEEEYLQDGTIFSELVNKSEFRILLGDKQYQLNADQAVFQRTLTKLLKSHSNYPEILGEFIQDVQNHLEDPIGLKWSLMPTVTSSTCNSARGENQDSLVRLLLGIDLIQERLAQYLLEKIAEVAACEQSIFDQEKEINLTRLILSQFRWLDKLLNSQNLASKLMEILIVTPLDVQRDIIISMPDILDDADHPEIACKLSEMLLENHELSVAILDTLSNLNIKPETVSQVRSTVLKTLSSVNLEDLPVVVRFVLQNLDPQEAFQVINELRIRLEFVPTISSSSSSTFAQASAASSSRGYEFLTLDAIRSALRFQKSLWDTWIKAIEAAKDSSDHKPIDFLVLLVLHSLAIRVKQVESLLRNKIRAGHFNEIFLQVTFATHTAIIREYFSSFLTVAEVLLRSNESVISNFGSSMYQRAFIMFDTYCRQEIVGNLVTHVGGGTVIEVDTALDTLFSLVQEHMEEMAPFGTFIKSLLDHMDNLPLNQIRKVYGMLSVLAYQGRQEGSLVQDDMHILIRKQLTNNNPKYRRMGVIGALMTAKSMASTKCSTVSASRLSTSTTSEESVMIEIQKEAVALLELVRSSTYHSPEALALFCDELARIVQRGELDEKVEAWIDDTVINDFQDDFIIDIDPENFPKLDCMELELNHNLDESGEGGIALNLTPLIVKNERSLGKAKLGNSNKQVSPLVLASTFRLLRICEYSQHGGTLDGIDALLGCPVCLPHSDLLTKFSSLSTEVKHYICSALFLCINWFREVVNGFALVEEGEMKWKVLQRLRNIVDMQKLLQSCLADTPGYLPPVANFDCDKIDPTSLQQSTAKAATGKGKGKGKRGRKAGTKKSAKQSEKSNSEGGTKLTQVSQNQKTTQIDNTCSSSTGDSQKNKSEDDKVNGPPSAVNLAPYQSFFRELDMDIFAVLHNGVSFEDPTETQGKKELCLHPPVLKFVLEDLVHKLEHSLLASTSKRNPAFKSRSDKKGCFSNLEMYSSSEVAAFISRLLPVLCQLLESTSGYFQDVIAESDGIVDGPKMFTPESIMTGSCMQLLLQTLHTFFSWKGLSEQNHHKLLQESLMVLAVRLGEPTATNSLQDLVNRSSRYLEKFADSVASVHIASSLVKLLQSLFLYSENLSLKERLAATAGDFLKKDWRGEDGQKEKGAVFNEHIQCLLKCYLSHSNSFTQPLETLTTVAIPQLVENDKDSSSDYPTLTRHTFSTYYRMMHCELAEGMRAYCSKRQDNVEETNMEHLVQWSLAVRIFHILVSLVKAFDGRSNLAACLKYSRQFVDTFLRHGMPLLDGLFRNQREDVQNLLKNLQLSTRYLQHICSHSKVTKDITLTNQVPFLKKTLETFVFRVKAMLTVNKCKEAFWLGNLKNRDLQGEEILSQSTTITDTTRDSHDSESDVPLEDDKSDVDLEEDNRSPVLSDTTEDN